MKLLLDTHVFLWRLLGDPRLSHSADAMIDDIANQLFLSSISGFEIAVKVAIEKLKLPADVAGFIEAGMINNQITSLPVTFRHAYGVSLLPLIHRDPFDRLLVCCD